MTVYVESNFVLEIALGQEQSADAEVILTRAERGEVELAVPSFALSEPFSTVTHRTRSRRRLSNDLSDQVRDLNRSLTHRQDAAALEPLTDMLVQVGQRETHSLISTVERLLAVATVIQVDSANFRYSLRYRSRYDLSEQDAIIFAAVVSHLVSNPRSGPHYFMNRNRRDFDDPSILDVLSQLGCTFVASFREGALRLERPGSHRVSEQSD